MEFYVYVLFRPWNGLPCYVGKGKGSRLSFHEKMACGHPNRRMARIFTKAARLGLAVPCVKIREGLSETHALEIERAVISAIGRRRLCNLTDGGEGLAQPSPEIRARLSAAQKKRFDDAETRDRTANATRLAWLDPEKRKRMLENRKKQIISAERREKVSKFHTGKTMSVESRRKISQSLKGHVPSQETRALWSKQRKGRKR